MPKNSDGTDLTALATGDTVWVRDVSDTTNQATGELKTATIGTLLGTGAFTRAFQAISDGDTTPTVANGNRLQTANTSGTSITTFDGSPADGDTIYLWIDDANTTLVHSAGTLFLAGQENVTPDADTVLEFVYDGTGTEWKEIGRRVFNLANGADITFSAAGNDYTAALTNTGVTANTYANATVTVDAKGRLTAASAGSGFDSQVPLAIDLDTPSTDDVVATFTADSATTSKLARWLIGATETLFVSATGFLGRDYNINYSDVLNTTQTSDQVELFMDQVSVSNGFIGWLQELTVRATAAYSSGRIVVGSKMRTLFSRDSTQTTGGTSELIGLQLSAENNDNALNFPIVTALEVSAGQSRALGSVTTAQAVKAQIISTDTVTTGNTFIIKSPTTPANVTTSTGLTIEAHDIDINSAGGVIIFSNLPTGDPVNAGQLWNNSGVLTVSAG